MYVTVVRGRMFTASDGDHVHVARTACLKCKVHGTFDAGSVRRACFLLPVHWDHIALMRSIGGPKPKIKIEEREETQSCTDPASDSG